MDIPAVGLDVDGVLSNFVGYAYPLAGMTDSPRTWEAPKTKQKALRDVMNMPSTWVNLRPLPGAVEAVSLLVQAGVIPVFITSMPMRFHKLREWWIETHFGQQLGRNPVYLESVKQSSEKVGRAREYGLTHFVEDKRETANAFAAAGFTSILVPSSYHADGPIDPRVKVQPLLDFATEVATQCRERAA